MRERTDEQETAALLRRLRRMGVRDFDATTVAGGRWLLRTRVQVGRAHRQVTSEPAATQYAALLSLEEEVRKVAPRPERKPPEVRARRVHRPEAGKPGTAPEPADVSEDPAAARQRRREVAEERRRQAQERFRERTGRAPGVPMDRPGGGGR